MAKKKLTLKIKEKQDPGKQGSLFKSIEKGTSQDGYSLDQGVTQSILSRFVQCRIAAMLYLDGWRTTAERRALSFGSLMHSLIESWYAPVVGVKSAKLDDCPLKIFQKIAKDEETTALAEKKSVIDLQADLGSAKALFPGYCERWHDEDQKREWCAVEQQFDILFHAFRLRGKIDGLFRAKDGSAWLLETKTASQISDDTMSQALAFDFQSLFYCLAVELATGHEISGVLYNIIRTPSIGKGLDKTTTAYVDLIKDDIQKRPEWYFVRYEIAYPRATRVRFSQELLEKLEDFKSWILGEIPSYKNESACRGRWNCEYLPVCAAGGDPEKAGFQRTGKLFSELEEK